MLRIKYNEKKLTGSFHLPASKSISNRLLVMRALAQSKVLFDNLSEAEDTYMMRLYLSFINTCAGSEIPLSLDTHNAGTVFRFLLAYLSRQEGKWLLTGQERMRQRPIGALVDALRSLGADIRYTDKEGFPPLIIKGKKLNGGTVYLNASSSSQYVSALMLIAPYLPGGLTIQLESEPVSSAYIEMTAVLMRRFGAEVSVLEKEIRVGEGSYKVEKVKVEPDWSAAAFWYEMVAFQQGSEAFLPGLSADSVQGDRFLVTVFEKLGVRSEMKEDGLLLRQEGSAGPVDFDFSNAPDIVPSVMVACAGLGVEGRFTGIEHLRIKESDRIRSMQLELGKVGARIEKQGEAYHLVPGKVPEKGKFVFDSHGDHRMAMSLAPLAMKLQAVSVKDPDVVQKSYPDYWDEIKKTGIFQLENVSD